MSQYSRRKALQAGAAAALSPLATPLSYAAQVPPAPKEGKSTPRIALGMGDGGLAIGPNQDRAAAARRIKQLGVDHVLSGGPPALPWTEEILTAVMQPWKAAGIQVSNLMI